MAKYNRMVTPPPPKQGVHPVWRGIGCLMWIVLPVISYAAAVLLIDLGLKNRWSLPYEWLGYPTFPAWVWSVPVLSDILYPITQINNLYAIIIFTIAIFIALAITLWAVYSLLYRLVGPSRFGPYDIPPPKYKPKSYKR